MTSEYTTYATEFIAVSARWAHPDADRCGCGGCGYWLSELDTWHKCPHHDGPHPEDDGCYEPAPVLQAFAWGLAEAGREAARALIIDDCPF